MSYATLAIGWLGIAAGWVLNGLSLWAVLQAAGYSVSPQASEKFLLCIIAGALSMVAGFLSLIPGGAGVREAILIALLPPMFGDAAAVVSAVLFRLVSLVAELAISAILYFSGPRRTVDCSGPLDVNSEPRP